MSFRARLVRVASPPLLAAATALATGAVRAEVAGSFVAAGQTIAPRHAGAFVSRSPRDARKHVVEVVLSEQPIDAAAAAAALVPHTQVINQEALRANYVLLWIHGDGSVGMNATFAATMSQYLTGTGDGLVAELSENTRERVAGRVYTPQPLKTMSGEEYRVDLRFSTAVAQPPAGKPLAAGGAEPGAVLATLLGALERKDWDAIRVLLSARQRADFEADYRTAEENRDYALDVLSAWLPKAKARVLGGELRAPGAVLEVEGEIFEGMSSLFLAQMVEEGGAWVFDSAQTIGFVN